MRRCEAIWPARDCITRVLSGFATRRLRNDLLRRTLLRRRPCIAVKVVERACGPSTRPRRMRHGTARGLPPAFDHQLGSRLCGRRRQRIVGRSLSQAGHSCDARRTAPRLGSRSSASTRTSFERLAAHSSPRRDPQGSIRRIDRATNEGSRKTGTSVVQFMRLAVASDARWRCNPQCMERSRHRVGARRTEEAGITSDWDRSEPRHPLAHLVQLNRLESAEA